METSRKNLRLKRHRRLRLRVYGDSQRPRLVVHRSSKNISAQIIDDTQNKTLFSLSTAHKEIKKNFSYAGNVRAAEFFGQVFSKELKEKGFSKVVFDRAGYLYHGRIKAFAEALRKEGIAF